MTSTDALDMAAWWRRVMPWWHVAFAVTWALVLALVLAQRGSAVVTVPMLVLAAAYPPLGVPALRRDSVWHAVAYLLVATAALAWAIRLQPAGMLLLICVYPQCFAMLGRLRDAVTAVVVLTVACSTALAAHDGWTGSAVGSAAATGAINMAIALGLGTFVDAVIREAERRAALVTALAAAQHDLETAHREAGMRAERERLAREIHDTLAQGFTSILVLARALDAELGDQASESAHRTVKLLEETAQSNLDEARSLVAAQPPTALAEMGLVGALRRATDRCEVESGVATALDIVGTPRTLSSSYDVVLLRVTQEALTNVARHSGAARAHVTLDFRADGVSLAVGDDGVGFAEASDLPNRYGLAGMRQRVADVGGELQVESSPGQGTTVRVMLP